MRRVDKKVWLLVIVVIAGACFIYFARFHKSANVNLVVSPSAASVVMDGTKHLHQGQQYITPGNHSLVAEFNGFAKKTIKFSTTDSLETINVILNPNSQAGYTWLDNHPNDVRVRQNVGGNQFNQVASSLLQRFPIVAKLPYTDSGKEYRVDYGSLTSSNPQKLTIYITYASATAQQQALNWITGTNTDLSTLAIKNINDPLLVQLPYSAIDFSLTNLSPADTPTPHLNATLYLSAADATNQDAATEEYKQEVLQFIESTGANPANYNITYQIAGQ